MSDRYLVTGGTTPPQTCTALGGQGACLSRCVPLVEQALRDPTAAAVLQRGDCRGADELCIPCVDPRSNRSTNACDLARYTMCVN